MFKKRCIVKCCFKTKCTSIDWFFLNKDWQLDLNTDKTMGDYKFEEDKKFMFKT